MERGNGIIVVPVSIVIDKTRAIVEIDICRNLSPLCSAALLSHGPTVIFKIARSLSGFIKFPGLTSNPVHRSPWIFYLSRVFEYRILSTENFEGKSFLQFWLVFLSIFLFFSRASFSFYPIEFLFIRPLIRSILLPIPLIFNFSQVEIPIFVPGILFSHSYRFSLNAR